MNKGIYIALSGATLKQTQMDIISNNLANANTAGFKRDKISFQEHLLSQMNNRVEYPDGRTLSSIGTVTTDHAPGSVVHTGNDFDIAIDGEGFLTLENGQYTRRGDLRLDSEGYVVNHRGVKVLGTGGPIQITAEGRVSISNEGEVSVKTAEAELSVMGTIRVVTFSDTTTLSKSGEDAFTADSQAPQTVTAAIAQGYLEKSNVDAVKEMVQMITALREFEAYQKAIQSFDDSIGRVLSDMPRI
ncbi:MAG: flagellar basal-body rod protein FlgF [Nitrospirae bacterium]|nr:flagellar basal-body rod protein FlgF [Nitrospirota bacterium]